uniref:DUF148 domain-containing protein n=1 Tax=Rhabditophanes sp. KR3021 TaxID=114890 RepID=A0AC35TPV4_9BILA
MLRTTIFFVLFVNILAQEPTTNEPEIAESNLINLPPFMENASEESKKEFVALFSDEKLSRADIEQKLQEIVDKDPSEEVKTQFKEAKETMAGRESELKDKISQQSDKLEGPAKEVFARISKIAENKSMSIADIKQSISEIKEDVRSKDVMEGLQALKNE